MTKLLFTVLSLCLLSICAFDRMTIHNGISMYFLKDKFISNNSTIKQLNCVGGNACKFNHYINNVICTAVNQHDFNCTSILPNFLTMQNISMTCDNYNYTKYIHVGSCRLYYNLDNKNIVNTSDNIQNMSKIIDNKITISIPYSSIIGIILCLLLAGIHIYSSFYLEFLNMKKNQNEYNDIDEHIDDYNDNDIDVDFILIINRMIINQMIISRLIIQLIIQQIQIIQWIINQ